MSGVNFDKQSAKRIATTVRAEERRALPSRGPALKRRGTAGSGSGSGSFNIDTVAELPAIPTSGVRAVYWGDEETIENGTGDNSYWIAREDDTEWSPWVYLTALTGEPSDE